MSTSAAIILARLDSSRLPRKQLEALGGRSILAHIVEACRLAADKVVVATTERELDNDLVRAAEELRVHVFRGDLNDVAGRFLGAALQVDADIAIRVNADSPFVRSEMLLLALQEWEKTRSDIVTNVPGRTWPFGLSVEAVSVQAMGAAHRRMTAPSHREHVTQHFYETIADWRVSILPPGPPIGSGLQLAVDTPQDLERARHIAEKLGEHMLRASVSELIELARTWESAR